MLLLPMVVVVVGGGGGAGKHSLHFVKTECDDRSCVLR
jgi:hypothetical protein